MKTKIFNVLVALLLVLGCSLAVAVPAAVAQTTPASGTISGTVTSTGSPDNVSVYAQCINGNPGAGFGITDNRGKYTIAGLPFGAYIVYSPAGGGSADANYVRQYYNDKPGQSTADTVNISAGSPNTIDINFNFKPAGYITGLVTAGGIPVAGVKIVAEVNNTFEYVTNTTTGGSGNYTLYLPVGSYVVQARPSDALLPYADKFYNNVYFQNLVTPVPVTLGATTTNINFSLDPAGSITGRVTAGGTPLANVLVSAKDPITGGYVDWVTYWSRWRLYSISACWKLPKLPNRGISIA